MIISLDKEKIYQLIKEETERMHLTFQPYNKGVNFGFLISNGKEDVYGSVHSNEMPKDIYQGISKISYEFYNSNGKKNFIILVDKKENHFLVIPFNIMKNDFFPRQSDDYIHYDFNISRYPYTLQKSKTDLTKYQDNLDIIFQELTSKKATSEVTIELTKQQSEMNSEMPIDEKEVYVFVTGYNGENLEKSKTSHILGWTRGSNFLSKGSLVFVFDKTNLYLDSCFRVISKSDNTELIWVDEIKSGKLIYPNRWKVELIQDSLKIPLSYINGITPFDKEPFQGLLRGNFPMPLNSPQNKDKYETFRKFILDKLINYWIFIVADQPKLKLSAEDIYQTRMNDKFWGLNEHTPYRKQLKKGDLVIFCHGAKKFLGTAKLETNCFEPTEEQKIKFSHNIDFYKPKYGIMLSDIERWQKPKEVVEYVPHLSFILNIQQFPVYFQGGIKKIRTTDYHLITDTNFTAKEGSDIYQDKESTQKTRQPSLWLVRAGDRGEGAQTALEKNCVGIGYGGLPELHLIKDFETFKEQYKKTHPDDNKYRVGQVISQIWKFMYEIKIGDFVILPLSPKLQTHSSWKNCSEYQYGDLHSEIQQFRSVHWLKKDVNINEFDPEIQQSFDAHGTVRL